MNDGGRIRLLVSDVDGTFVTKEKALTRASIDAVAALTAAGIRSVFVSSRPPMGFATIARKLALSAEDGRPAFGAFNGGALLDASLKPLTFSPLPDADARTTLAHLASMKIGAWVFTLDRWYVVDPDGPHVEHEHHTIDFPPTVVESLNGIEGIGKIVGCTDDEALLAEAEKTLAPKLSKEAVGLRSQTYYLDVTHADANKGAALRAIAAREGVDVADVAAIGDMTNDLAMLTIAGFSIAMGNAPDDVKAQVDTVTASNDDDGFAKAIHDHVLPRARNTP